METDDQSSTENRLLLLRFDGYGADHITSTAAP